MAVASSAQMLRPLASSQLKSELPFSHDNKPLNVRNSSSYCQLGAIFSSLNGDTCIRQRQLRYRMRPQSCISRKQVIQAVLAGERDTDVAVPKNSGIRGKLNKVVLAYSGGLDTSVIVPWLRENYGCDVVCFTADVGQGVQEMDGLEKKAKASGASQLVVKDLKEEFVRDYIFPCLRAGAIYERKYLLGTSMARPVIAKAMVDVAKEVGADAVSHGCTGKGNDQVRFELTFFALNPELNVVAPWREWEITGREDAIEYAKRHNVPVPVTKKSIYSRDRNLWHISHEIILDVEKIVDAKCKGQGRFDSSNHGGTQHNISMESFHDNVPRTITDSRTWLMYEALKQKTSLELSSDHEMV